METTGTATLVLETAYRFKVDLGLANVPSLTTDATPPLGRGQGPDSERLFMP